MKHYILLAIASGVLLTACSDPPPADAGDVQGTDAVPTDVQRNDVVVSGACNTYCSQLMTNCSGANAQFADMAACQTYCAGANWPAGEMGATSGNSLGCRIYHGGAPAMTAPAMHCVHAGPTGGEVCGSYCENFCQLVQQTCTGANAQYPDPGACMTACMGFPATGMPGDTQGDTVQCRLYHAGAPALADPALHCRHAAANGGGVCGGGAFAFRTDPPAMYTRVDRMGMPAVATALVSSGQRNAYNDANPSDDAMSRFASELVANLTAIHMALDDDLTRLMLTPCSMTTIVNGLPECLGQNVAPGVTVASLVLPDTLTVNPAAAAGFPNGRRLQDPVIDVTLAVVLLRLGATCGAGMCTPATLAGVPLNPAANDVMMGMFPDAFPYLQPAQTP